MRKCPYCGRDNDDNANVCAYCYGELPKDNDKDEKQEETIMIDGEPVVPKKRTRS